MLYFVKRQTLHTFPAGQKCSVNYNEEPLRDTVPHGFDECIYCLNTWPDQTPPNDTRRIGKKPPLTLV
jgi:hypothetical protein